MVKKDKSVVVVIELEFNESPTYSDVLDYLNAIMDDGCLDYYEKSEEVK